MILERALKVVLVLVGLLFCAGVYPVIGGLLHPADSDTGDTMMMSVYFALGIFLRNPSAHRSLVAFGLCHFRQPRMPRSVERRTSYAARALGAPSNRACLDAAAHRASVASSEAEFRDTEWRGARHDAKCAPPPWEAYCFGAHKRHASYFPSQK